MIIGENMEKLRKILVETIIIENNIKQLLQEIIIRENKKNETHIELRIEELKEPCNSYTEDNVIHLNKILITTIDYSENILKKNNIYQIVKNIYHEIAHMNQQKEAGAGMVSNNSLFFITTNLIHDYLDPDDYLRNYSYQEIEILANQYAWNQLLILLGKEKRFNNVVMKIQGELKRLKGQMLLLNRLNNNKQTQSICKLLPQNLNQVVRENPKILRKYPVLLFFYYENGVSKDIIEILFQIKLETIYENAHAWVYKVLFEKILTEDSQQLAQMPHNLQNRYIELLKKMIKEYMHNLELLSDLESLENKFTMGEYHKMGLLIINKINMLNSFGIITDEDMIDLKDKIVEQLENVT